MKGKKEKLSLWSCVAKPNAINNTGEYISLSKISSYKYKPFHCMLVYTKHHGTHTPRTLNLTSISMVHLHHMHIFIKQTMSCCLENGRKVMVLRPPSLFEIMTAHRDFYLYRLSFKIFCTLYFP